MLKSITAIIILTLGVHFKAAGEEITYGHAVYHSDKKILMSKSYHTYAITYTYYDKFGRLASAKEARAWLIELNKIAPMNCKKWYAGSYGVRGDLYRAMIDDGHLPQEQGSVNGGVYGDDWTSNESLTSFSRSIPIWKSYSHTNVGKSTYSRSGRTVGPSLKVNPYSNEIINASELENYQRGYMKKLIKESGRGIVVANVIAMCKVDKKETMPY